MELYSGEIMSSAPSLKQTIVHIKEILADFYSFHPMELTNGSRKSKIVRAKKIFVYLAKEHLKLPSSSIASELNLDHSSVHHLSRVLAKLSFDRDEKKLIANLKAYIDFRDESAVALMGLDFCPKSKKELAEFILSYLADFYGVEKTIISKKHAGGEIIRRARKVLVYLLVRLKLDLEDAPAFLGLSSASFKSEKSRSRKLQFEQFSPTERNLISSLQILIQRFELESNSILKAPRKSEKKERSQNLFLDNYGVIAKAGQYFNFKPQARVLSFSVYLFESARAISANIKSQGELYVIKSASGIKYLFSWDKENYLSAKEFQKYISEQSMNLGAIIRFKLES